MKKYIFLSMIVLIAVGTSGCCWPWGCDGGGYRDGGYRGGERGGERGRDRGGEWHHDR